MERDYEKAISFCRKSARMGNTWAMRLLGFCYKTSPVETGGITASIEWFRRAAERGDKVGQRKLAEIYENGEGVVKLMEDDRDRLVVIIAGYTAEIGSFLQINPGLKSRFARFIEFPDYSVDELAEIFARMASAELYSLKEDVADIVHRKMESLVESKTTSFGNARAVRTFYEKVKGRQAVRLAKIDHPSRAQMTELLPEDV